MARKTVARRPAAKPRRPKIKLPAARRGRRLPPGMVRLDYPKVRGYLVRIGYTRTRNGWGPKYKAYFSDTRCGGKAKTVLDWFSCEKENPLADPAAFDYGNYALGPYAGLQETIDQFSGSWARESIATNRGFNVATVFVPLWADPERCLRNESPLACELRLNRPSFVIITMETWWGGDPSGYESYLRRIVEYAIARGSVPILGTKADNIEGNGSINGVIVKLAQEYDVPLWNFWAAVQPLPNHGLHSDGFHLTWERNYYDNPAALQAAWPIRNLTAAQSIEAVWRGVTAP